MKLLKILVIDDEPFGEVIGHKLKKEGHKVFNAKDGKSGIEFIRQHFGLKLDLVITDRRMPGMLGEEVIRSIKRDFPGIKMILMTSHLDKGIESMAIAAGAEAVLDKMSLDALADTIKKLFPE
jgi:CheY-like chemotaxis protein